jgi:hypothetical protein
MPTSHGITRAKASTAEEMQEVIIGFQANRNRVEVLLA